MRTTRRVIIIFAAGAIPFSGAAAASAAAVTRAGAVAPAAQGVTTGVRPPAAGDASATGAARPAGSWGRAIAVPGLAALSQGGGAEVSEVSCTSAGNCAAGGYYTDRHHDQLGFVADERHGRWGKAIEVPGLGALNVSGGGGAAVVSVSCGSAGNCAAGGFYANDAVSRDIGGLFVVAEHGGRWGKAVALPADGEADSISCTSAGNCLAGGEAACDNCYFDTGDAFVVQERAGRWGSVRFIPGLRKLEHNVDPEIAGSWINSVACTSAGNCAAGGGYEYDGAHDHGFVAVERNGVWAKAIEVPGLAALNKGGDSAAMEVSCGSAGDCAAGGYYRDPGRHYQGFVAVERNGAWGTAIEVPGLAALNKGERAAVNSVSCGSAGSCVAGGAYADRSHRLHGLVAVERNGRWATAIQVPGLAALSKRGDAFVTSVSCASAGNCAAGGYYTDRSGHRQGFVAVERNGVWGTAIPVPGLSALKAGGSAEVSSLSCTSRGHCAASGSFRGRSGHRQGFVTQAG
jgi:hypothetical protein